MTEPTQNTTQKLELERIEWTKDGIMKWLYKHDVYGQKTMSEQRIYEDAFMLEANKHQDTFTDRKLYRKALKIIECGKERIDHHIKVFMDL